MSTLMRMMVLLLTGFSLSCDVRTIDRDPAPLESEQMVSGFKIRNEFADPNSAYYSQASQDRFVNETFFKGKKGGVFIEIGAYDGETYSNTKYFEEILGWTGLLIEPLPEAFHKLKAHRTSTAINGCISGKAGRKLLLNAHGVEMLSGLVDFYDQRHIERIESEVKEAGGYVEKIDVECYNLNELCDDNGITHVDFLSLDVEGAELNILESIDFKKLSIDILTIENNYADPRIKALMESRGYRLVQRLEMDEVYKKAPTP